MAHDAVVVGSGPNGLAAAITLALAGRRVLVREAQPTIGGGLRSAELTLPGYTHDVCAAVHPLAISSPFFASLPLAPHGLEWIHPDAPLAHPLDGGRAAVLERSLADTAARLDAEEGRDGDAWRRLLGGVAEHWDDLVPVLLAPLTLPKVPPHPLLLAKFGLQALRSADAMARGRFRGERARALFAGSAGHSFLPLTQRPSAAIGLVLSAAAHAVGWPIARGGSQRLADALVSYLRSLGGDVAAGAPVEDIGELDGVDTVLLDLTPRGVLRIAGERLPPRYREALSRYRLGPGAFKLDWALDGPVPWTNPECLRAATVHVGGTLDEIAAAEGAVGEGKVAERPFVLLVQPTIADPSRAPEGKHVVWAYCHVPNGSTVDMSDAIERQIERFAPGFRERVLARHVTPPAALERHNANYTGGDIGGGALDLRQTFFRPVARVNPYRTPLPGVWLCSSATPPGPGVHGMAGHQAARFALRDGRRGRRRR